MPQTAGKRKRAPPAANLQVEFRRPEVQAKVLQAIRVALLPDASQPLAGASPPSTPGGGAAVPTPKEKRLTEALTEALCNDKNHVGMGLFMALLSVSNYRYTRDPSKKELVLLRYNGAVYEPRAGTADLDVGAQKTVVLVVKGLQDLLGPMEKVGEGTANDDEGAEEEDDDTKKEIANALRARVAQLLNTQLGNNTYLNSVRNQMHDVMATDAFYTDNEMAPPEEFFLTLDSNPNLLGFPNGVLNLREPDGGMRFYGRGEAPPAFAVSMSVGYKYAGSVDGTPNGEAQQRELAEVLAKVRLMFLKQAMWDAARLVFGSIAYGGNENTRAAIMLLGPTKNAKSWAEKISKIAFGPQYVVSFTKKLIIKFGKEDDDTGPTHQLSRIYRARAVFSSETGEDDEPNDYFKGWIGGDQALLRPMYGNMYEAPVLPKFFVPSNFPLKHDSNDPAWADPAVGRLRCALSYDTKFRNVEADDLENGICKAEDAITLKNFYEERRTGVLLMFLKFAKEFAAAGFNLPLTPESIARSRVLAAGSCAGFIAYVKENYESTELRGKPGWADYETHGRDAAMNWLTIFDDYNGANADDPIKKRPAKKALAEHLGYDPKSIINPTHGFKGLGGNGVMLKRKAADE